MKTSGLNMVGGILEDCHMVNTKMDGTTDRDFSLGIGHSDEIILSINAEGKLLVTFKDQYSFVVDSVAQVAEESTTRYINAATNLIQTQKNVLIVVQREHVEDEYTYVVEDTIVTVDESTIRYINAASNLIQTQKNVVRVTDWEIAA